MQFQTDRHSAHHPPILPVGRASHPDAPEQKKTGLPTYGPSAICARGGKFRFLEGIPGYQVPTAIDDPEDFINLFRKAAVNAKTAGFDGVESELLRFGSCCTEANVLNDSTSSRRQRLSDPSVPRHYLEPTYRQVGWKCREQIAVRIRCSQGCY